MKKILFYLLIALTIASCKKDLPQTQSTPIVLGVKFYIDLKNNTGIDTAQTDSSKIDLVMAGDSVVGVVPGISNKKSFVLSFEPATANVKVGNIVQKSGVTVNDFSQPVNYTFTNSQGKVTTYRISISNFTGLPIFYLTTASPVVSEDDYVTGNLSINANAKFNQSPSSIDLDIKGRGNSTWTLMPKKPYRLKFNSKEPLLGLKAAKNWVLLANYADKTLLRNALAFDVGHQVSADFTPNYRFVEVVMNGIYIGNYMLTEQVEVNPGRVDISDSDITGGYLLELDARLDADYYFYTSRRVPFTIKDPDDISADRLAYIHTYIQQAEDALFSDGFQDKNNGYAKFINVDSFIDWYLVKELMKDNDALDNSSIFYYKDVNGKLGMGPVWDFDLAAGNYAGTNTVNPTGWWVRNGTWFNRLFTDPAFVARVKQRWGVLKTTFPAVLDNLDANAAYLDLSQQQNFKTWDILNTYVWPNPEVAGSYEGEVDYLKTWLNNRVKWMDANM